MTLTLLSDPTATNLTTPHLRSRLRVTWGILLVIDARSVGLTASIAKRVPSKTPVGIVTGTTRDMSNELSTSDRFGEFRSYFRMPLSKVEDLTDYFIIRGYLKPARSLKRRAEFRERSELFIMTALYRLLDD